MPVLVFAVFSPTPTTEETSPTSEDDGNARAFCGGQVALVCAFVIVLCVLLQLRLKENTVDADT